MAIAHLASGDTAKLQPLGDKLPGTPTTALFKDARMEAIRIVLTAGKRMPEHKVVGPITVQCIEGRVEIRAGGKLISMEAGDLLYLEGGVSHDLIAIENCSLLVTIAIVN